MEVILLWVAVLGAHTAVGEAPSQSGVIARGLTETAEQSGGSSGKAVADGGSRQEKLSCFNMESDDWILMQRFSRPLAANTGEL